MIAMTKGLRPFRAAWAFVILGLSASAAGQTADSSSFQGELYFQVHSGSDSSGAVIVDGLSPEILTAAASANLAQHDWQELFPVFTGTTLPTRSAEKPPVLGTYKMEGTRVIYRPRFAFVAGMNYCAGFDLPALCSRLGLEANDGVKMLTATCAIPSIPMHSTTTVSHIYPSTARLPVNQLKFYIFFSAPMSRGGVYEKIELLNASGKRVEKAFLELEPELWDSESRRLTLFFDPGRIKRGLRPHEDLGLALKQWQTFSLLVRHDLRDARGQLLVRDFRKEFTVGMEDRQSPDTSRWLVNAPAAETHEPLSIQFEEPLDYALLARLFTVRNPNGHILSGSIKVTEAETRWLFIPDTLWRPGEHLIEVEPALEDLAGNKLNKPFDVDVQDQLPAGGTDELFVLKFTVLAGNQRPYEPGHR